jgi:hypothetical protein
VLTALVALGAGVLGAYLFLNFFNGPPRPVSGDESTASKEELPSTRDLTDQLSKVSDRVEKLSERVDAIPKPGPPPDLADLQVQVADLTRASQELAPLRRGLKEEDDRLEEVRRLVRTLSDEVRALRSRTGTLRMTAASNDPPVQPEPGDRKDSVLIKPVPEKMTSAGALAPGATLYRQQKYKEALDAFTRLEQTNPDDARVWYYAALAHGFTTRRWNGEGTIRLVEKGVACERAGNPSKTEVDEAFKGLTSANGKDWLANYRLRAATPATETAKDKR